MSRMRMDQEILEVVPEKPSACTKFLHYTWKTITFLFSHIALVSTVVSYCALGAFTFEALEVEHEKEVKRKISGIRNNVTNYLWNLTLGFNVLDEDNFTRNATDLLYNFESALVKSMTKDGWDGEEDESTVQWTRTGSLFYSIVVITTIGYGHIAPKTTWGKVVTIFYAILGIPLMLLCLSNIGDIMATSFRFLYWKICCYACTRPKKPRRSRSVRSGRAMSERSRSVRNPSFRRSVRTSTRSGDSGFDFSEVSTHPTSHSDTELRIANEMNFKRVQSLPKMRQLQNQNQNNLNTGTLPSRKRSAPTKSQCPPNPSRIQAGNRGGSLDRKKISKGVDLDLDPFILNKIPILCADQYMISRDEFVDMCINEQEEEEEAIPGIQLNKIKRGQSPPNERRSLTLPRPQRSSLNMPRPKSSNFLELPRGSSPTHSERSHTSARSHQSTRKVHRKKSPVHSSPKMMTPLGYGHKSKYLDDPESDEEFYDDIYYDAHKTRTPPVPIWLCVFLVVSYIIAGAFLFQNWENWRFIDAAYFCFITLTTIGFGDLVPAKGVSQNVGGDETTTAVTISIALCSLYLLFGISLLAMSFNLVQEQVINSVKSVAKTLGIIKSEGDETDDEDY